MILMVMFLLGAFASIAQVMLLREALVAFLGNELTIGASLANWMIGISIGAFVARLALRFFPSLESRHRLIGFAILSAGLCLPLQLYGLRIFRLIFGIPSGEYPGLFSIYAGSFMLFLPSALVVGVVFPFACASWQQNRDEGTAATVGRIYSIESFGSMAGGALVTFLLLPYLTTSQIILLSAVFAVGASAIMFRQRMAKIVLALLALAMAALALTAAPAVLHADRMLGLARAKAFGILSPEASGDSNVTRWIGELDTVYQNLALSESGGQYVLYADGQVLFQFPDPMGDEQEVHFAMAQNPGVKRILLFGGNPVGDIPELLKYNPQEICYVVLDPGLDTLIKSVVPEEYARVSSDGRVKFVYEDGPRFARRCIDKFDAILINAPEPTTLGANRYYTREFYLDVRRLLAPQGFVYTAVTCSERLEAEAADFGSSIYRSLKEAFPVVLVTAETRNRFFAGFPESGLTFSRLMLASRSESAEVPMRFFRPDYFIAADEIDDEKTARVEARFEAAGMDPNTNLKPTSCFLNLLMWSRSSGSGVESHLRVLKSLTTAGIVQVIIMIGLAAVLIGCFINWRTRRMWTRKACAGAWVRAMIAMVVLTTGLAALALELVMIFIFQVSFGYVYARIGLVFASFMLGLALGAPCGRFFARSKLVWLFLAALELGLIGVIAIVVKFADFAAAASPTFEMLFYGLVVLSALLVGAEYPIANRLYVESGVSLGKAAAVTDSADHFGAAIGAVVAGVALVPILGIAGACAVLMAVKASGVLFLCSAWLASGEGNVQPDRAA